VSVPENAVSTTSGWLSAMEFESRKSILYSLSVTFGKIRHQFSSGGGKSALEDVLSRN
jgi:hypothetical protein